jgi:amidase
VTTDAEIAYLPALEHARLIRTKELSPVELVEIYLRRIDQLNPHLNAYITVAADHALAAAKEAADAIGSGTDLPPLFGVPVSIKDLLDTAGIRTTMGTATYSDRVPDQDARTVRLLKEAGCLVLGKSNTAEFGVGSTDPIAYGACHNPWDLDRTTGGSSGGAAATTAAALCSIGLGTDGGGSVRIPAGFCGTVGLKPSRGRVSGAPRPQSMLAQPGPCARSVADAAAFLDAIAGPEPGDAFWAPTPAEPFLATTLRDGPRLRIAVATGPERISTLPEYADATRRIADLLTELGHIVVEAPADMWPDEAVETSLYLLYAAGCLSLQLPPLETMDPIFGTLLAAAREVPLADYIAAEAKTFTAVRDVVRRFDDFDVLISPTVAYRPELISKLRTPESTVSNSSILLTSMWNLTGQPALSLPLICENDGLPIGIQLVGRPHDEAGILRLGHELEQALPWQDRRPASEQFITEGAAL